MNNIIVTIHVDGDFDMLEDVQMVAPNGTVLGAASKLVRVLQDKYSTTRETTLIIEELESFGFTICEEIYLTVGVSHD